MREEWRPIRSFYHLYEVSNFGRVRSLRYNKIMKPHTTHSGHQRVGIFEGGFRKQKYIHVLVIESFVGKRPEGLQCAHLDGNPKNNRINNLKWCTPKENMSHKKLHGTHQAGETAAYRKFSKAKILRIRKDHTKGISDMEISFKYGVSRRHVNDIVKRRKWKSI